VQPNPQTIHARISQTILNKADRLFRNDDEGTFVELLQNSRRAGATHIDATIEQAGPGHCLVQIHDNGDGIANFEHLLTLGESGWSAETKAKEDPAGMGLYSLCLSGVEIFTGYRYAHISPEAFIGKEDAFVETCDSLVQGTRLCFPRTSSMDSLMAALARAARFYPVEVVLNGMMLPRHDFLEGAIYRECIDGIEIGFATEFAHDWSPYSNDKNWNFYGARIHEDFPSVRAIFTRDEPPELSSLVARFNVLETSRIKLQLPDRRGIIKTDFLTEFTGKAQAAACRCLQNLPRHALSFSDWKKARDLGIELPEAANLLTTWSGLALDTDGDQMFGEDAASILPNLDHVLIVESDLPNPHTLQGALQSGATLDYVLYRESPQYEGYEWYDRLPKLVDAQVNVDESAPGRPSKIEVTITIRQKAENDRTLILPAFVHVNPDETDSISFVAVENSPWDNEELNGPFSIVDFLIYATFSPSDDGDTWDTQYDSYRRDVEREVNEYFRGPRASLIALVQESVNSDTRALARRLDISQIVLTPNEHNEHQWQVELIGSGGEAI
jgi:hypothetical protein